jgi:transposase
MSYGYSNAMATLIKERHNEDPSNVLYAVAAICVERNIVPSEVAARLNVSKQTIYDYLQQKYSPKPDTLEALKAYLKELKKQKVKRV